MWVVLVLSLLWTDYTGTFLEDPSLDASEICHGFLSGTLFVLPEICLGIFSFSRDSYGYFSEVCSRCLEILLWVHYWLGLSRRNEYIRNLLWETPSTHPGSLLRVPFSPKSRKLEDPLRLLPKSCWCHQVHLPRNMLLVFRGNTLLVSLKTPCEYSTGTRSEYPGKPLDVFLETPCGHLRECSRKPVADSRGLRRPQSCCGLLKWSLCWSKGITDCQIWFADNMNWPVDHQMRPVKVALLVVKNGLLVITVGTQKENYWEGQENYSKRGYEKF